MLRAATVQAAEHVGLECDLGTLEPGNLADMVVLDADRLADISNTARVHYVVTNGVVFDVATMNPLNGPARRPFFWELGPDPQVAADEWLE
jgi:cytosine/adenosine deaminase-related metal-dependent hydrolase